MSEEQNNKKSVFNMESEDRVRSPEKLDEYIRVSSPATWLIVTALVLIFIAIMVWGFTGTMPVHYTSKGVGMTLGVDIDTADKSDAEAFQVKGLLCLVDPAAVTSHDLQDKDVAVSFRDGTRVNGKAMLLDTAPEQEMEVSELLKHFKVNSSWVVSNMGEGVYRYPVYVELEYPLDYLYWGEVGDAAFIIREEHPIQFLLGGGS